MVDTNREHLVVGLVGKRTDLFHENAHFHHSINALADMLPYWVDGIAAEAERQNKAAQGFLAHLKLPPMP